MKIKDDLSFLESCANKATKGEWIAVGSWVENISDDLPDIVCPCYEDRGPEDSYKKRVADADYIAAAQPRIIKLLIAEIRELRSGIK